MNHHQNTPNRSGWAKIYRTISTSKSAQRGVSYIGAMVWLILNAVIEDQPDGLKRGQLTASYKDLAASWQVSMRSLRTILGNLIRDGFIEYSRGANQYSGSVITICNYNQYQSAPAPRLTQQPTQQNAVQTAQKYTEYQGITDSFTDEATQQPTQHLTQLAGESGKEKESSPPYPLLQEKEIQEKEKGQPHGAGADADAGVCTRKAPREANLYGSLLIVPPPENSAAVQAAAKIYGWEMTNDEADRFYSTYSSVGWVDRYGRVFRDWQKLLIKWRVSPLTRLNQPRLKSAEMRFTAPSSQVNQGIHSSIYFSGEYGEEDRRKSQQCPF